MKTFGSVKRAIRAVRKRFGFGASEGERERERERLKGSYYREISTKRLDEFLSKGYKERHFFRIGYIMLPNVVRMG